jgi:hypothetical protein
MSPFRTQTLNRIGHGAVACRIKSACAKSSPFLTGVINYATRRFYFYSVKKHQKVK